MKHVQCSSCGRAVPDTPQDNADYEDRLQDTGFGMCGTCVNWAFDMVFKPIFKTVREHLNEKNQAKWDTLGDVQKATVVKGLLDKGVVKWRIN